MTGKSFRFVWIFTLLLLVTLACNVFSFAGGSSTGKSGVDEENIQKAAKTEVSLLDIPNPTRTPVNQSEDEIAIEYIYTDNLVTALYHLYGTVLDNFVDIKITNNQPESRTFVVQTQVDGYTNQASDTVDVTAGETLEIHQNPRLLAEAVDQLNSEKPGNFHIRIVSLGDDGEKLVMDETREIHIYSRRDFVWIDGLDWPEEYELWAAWATPNDPNVEALLRKAADYTKTGTIWTGYAGYVNDENGGVRDRLQAIWRAEQDYGLTYISTMTTFGPNTVQRMRLPGEVLNQASGNCIELALLFNSAAEAMGLETALVRIPGHVYSAIRMDTENANYYFVETTIIGQRSFDDAIRIGAANWEDALPHFDAEEIGYTWVNLPEARQKGILPIPWK